MLLSLRKWKGHFKQTAIIQRALKERKFHTHTHKQTQLISNFFQLENKLIEVVQIPQPKAILCVYMCALSVVSDSSQPYEL